MSDAREALRLELAAQAAEYAELTARYQALREDLRLSQEEESARRREVKAETLEQRRELSRVASLRAIAKKADTRLRSEFVDAELILAEARALQGAGLVRTDVKRARLDVDALRHQIEVMQKSDPHSVTLEREERRISGFEMRLSSAEAALEQAEAAAAIASAAVQAAWAAAREVTRASAET